MPGKIIVITGPPGSGKSNFAECIAEYHLAKNSKVEILSNILLKRPYPRYRYFKKQSHFLWHITRMGPGTWLNDEAGTFATSGAGGRTSIRGQLEGFSKLLRKFDLNTIWIDQWFDNSVPPGIRNSATIWYHIPEIRPDGQMYVDIEVNERKGKEWKLVQTQRWGRVSKIPYDHKSMATFQMDLPDDLTFFDVYDTLADTPSNRIKKDLEKWLLKHKIRPPKTAEFESFNYIYSTREAEKDPVIVGSGSSLDPGVRIDTRTVVWGILQRNPRIQTKKLLEILNLKSSTSIESYRAEFRGRKVVK